jgi:hypothetical protein
MKVFREVEEFSADRAMDGVDCAIRRMPQRSDQDFEPTPLQGEDLLRDEGFREPRITLQNEGDATWRPG